MHGFVQWSAVDDRAVSVMGVMCVWLFCVLCVSGCAWCALCWKWVCLCVVCFASIHVLIDLCVPLYFWYGLTISESSLFIAWL